MVHDEGPSLSPAISPSPVVPQSATEQFTYSSSQYVLQASWDGSVIPQSPLPPSTGAGQHSVFSKVHGHSSGQWESRLPF